MVQDFVKILKILPHPPPGEMTEYLHMYLHNISLISYCYPQLARKLRSRFMYCTIETEALRTNLTYPNVDISTPGVGHPGLGEKDGNIDAKFSTISTGKR
jgi:hypothetical protein